MSFFAKLFGSSNKIGGAEAVLMVKDGARLVDVRTAAERRGNCPRRSTHIPVEKVAQQCGQLGTKKPVVVVCAHGPAPAPPAPPCAATELTPTGCVAASARGRPPAAR